MSNAEQRIGHAEREAAVAALQAHASAGRLDSTEYEERSVQARQARTRNELTALFSDLPEPLPDPLPKTLPKTLPEPLPEPLPETLGEQAGLLPEPWAARIVSLTPFAALILFFATGHHWQWFLAVPIVGLIVYGKPAHGYGHGNKRR